MNFLKKVKVKQLWIYIGGAFVFNLILQYILQDHIINGLQMFYMIIPTALQRPLYFIFGSLSQLDLTPLELSVFFAVGVVEKLSILIELSIIGVLLWIVCLWIGKKWSKNKANNNYIK